VSIHPTAVVAPEAQIASDVRIGAFCVIGPRVRIGSGTVLESHARVGSEFGDVVLGQDNHIQTGAALGGPAQDLGYRHSAACRLQIGDQNRIGEYASIHLSAPKSSGATQLGHRNFVMAYAHVGHDCAIADDVVLTNGVQLGGHVSVGPRAVVGGGCGVTQFVRLGELCFIGAGSYVNKDVPPYTIAEGHWARMRACNRVGLRRAGMNERVRRNIERALRVLLRPSLTIDAALETIRTQCETSPEIQSLLDFVASSEKGVARRE
jgi:UDP-N-acetylglucosamine acyltransferase